MQQTINNLAAGENQGLTFNYTITESDIGKTNVINTITAQSDTAYIQAASPALKIEAVRLSMNMTVSRSNKPFDEVSYNAGESVSFNIVITNTSNQTLTNIAVSAVTSGASVNTATIETLGVGKNATVTGSYTVKSEDEGKEDLTVTFKAVSGTASVQQSSDVVPIFTKFGYYVYLYDGNTLHFSNKIIKDHGSKVLTNSWEMPEEGFTGKADAPWYRNESITSVTSNYFIAPKSIFIAFGELTNLVDISGLSKWNVENVISMQGVFYKCENLTDISPLSGWNTSNVESFKELFQGCTNLSNIEAVRNWKTESVTDLDYVFYMCSKLNDISPLSGWDVSSVTTMRFALSNTKISNFSAISSWKTTSLTNMGNMFSRCSDLTDLSALSNWNTSKVTHMNNLFSYCINIRNLVGIGNWNVSKVTTMYGMFRDCTSLTTISAISDWSTLSLEIVSYMFYNSKGITSFTPMDSWNISKITTAANKSQCFGSTSGKLPSWWTADFGKGNQ